MNHYETKEDDNSEKIEVSSCRNRIVRQRGKQTKQISFNQAKQVSSNCEANKLLLPQPHKTKAVFSQNEDTESDDDCFKTV